MTVELDDHRLAASLAASAGELLIIVRSAELIMGRALGDAGDAVAHEFLVRSLADRRPHDRVLSEEAVGGTDDDRHGERIWIIDPLDGTREYAEGRADWAVHIALVERGRVIAAAVALPESGEVRTTDATHAPGRAENSGPLRIAVSRSRPPEAIRSVADRLGAVLVPMGSAGAKVMAVVRGDVDAYVHAGGQYEWDSAAPVGVAMAAGLHASRVDGSVLEYDRPGALLPDLLVCRSSDAERIIAACVAEGLA